MADFDAFYRFISDLEGGFSDHPADHGGETHFGLTLSYLRSLPYVDEDHNGVIDWDADHDGDIDIADLRLMTEGQRREAWRLGVWERHRYHQLTSNMVALRAAANTVVAGFRPSSRVLQRALRAVEYPVRIDGNAGPVTFAAVDKCCRDGYEYCLVCALRSEMAGFFRLIVSTNPSQEVFLRGWENRAYQ